MSLFSNARYKPIYHSHPDMKHSGPHLATILPWVGMYLAAIMIIMFVLVGVSIFAIHLRPGPAGIGVGGDVGHSSSIFTNDQLVPADRLDIFTSDSEFILE